MKIIAVVVFKSITTECLSVRTVGVVGEIMWQTTSQIVTQTTSKPAAGTQPAVAMSLSSHSAQHDTNYSTNHARNSRDAPVCAISSIRRGCHA